jgi:hypothetical protein
MICTETSQETPLVVFDLEGDVILVLDKKRLLVSSRTLALASPVFKAMFSSSFKEGVQSRQTSDMPFVLPLLEDDPDALALLSGILHHQAHEILHEPDISHLESLAFVCDKYQCFNVVKYQGTVWLEQLLKRNVAEDLSRLLLVAYVLDLPECFSKISWELIQTHAGQLIDLPGLIDHPLVRHNFLCK